MGRQEHRAAVRENQKNTKIYNSLNPSQIEFIDKLTEHKAIEMVTSTMQAFEKEIFKVLRSNRISEDRAKKIIKDIEKAL